MNWNVDNTAKEKYLQVCKDAALSDDVFNTFKSDPYYTKILEHQSKHVGWNYFIKIIAHNLKLLNRKRIKESDAVGNPKTESYTTTIFGELRCSPTTLQYLGVLSNLIELYGSLHDYDIVEIGGGYGGQCKAIQDNFKVKDYTIIDLYEPTLLQIKYLVHFNMACKTFTQERYPHKKWDLVISNYALSEITEPLQTEYIKNILLNSNHGYITCNAPLNNIGLLKEKLITVSPDIDGEREENFIITW